MTGDAGTVPTVFRNATGAIRSPWRVAVFGVMVGACAIGVSGIVYPIAASTPVVAWSRVLRVPLDQLAIAGSVLLATWLTGWMVHGDGRQVWSLIGFGRDAWRPRTVILGAVAGALAIGVPTLAMIAGGAMRIEPAGATDSPALAAWAAFALLLPAAISEEVMIRGYLLSACRDGLGTWAAVGVTSVLFGLAHLANPEPTALSVVAVMWAGVFMAVVRVSTGSLVAACAAHLAFNLTQAVVFHAPVSGLALGTPGYRTVSAGPDWLTGGAWGPEGGAAVIAALAVATFLFGRRMPRQRTG
jgi:membrane protease YdiL (CAAX protease family)